MRVGLCSDSAPCNSTPIRVGGGGGGGEQRRGSILLKLFFIFFSCYTNFTNKLKGAF